MWIEEFKAGTCQECWPSNHNICNVCKLSLLSTRSSEEDIIILLLLIIYNCKVSVSLARKLSQLNGDPFFILGNISTNIKMPVTNKCSPTPGTNEHWELLGLVSNNIPLLFHWWVWVYFEHFILAIFYEFWSIKCVNCWK